MFQYMPTGGYQWIDSSLDGFKKLTYTSPIGRVYEIDISYPAQLNDDHSDLFFLPENSIPLGSNIRKLIVTLRNNLINIIHHRNLQQTIANGFIIEKVIRVKRHI